MVDISNKPVARVSLSTVAAAIWRNETKEGDAAFFSVTFERRYRDRDGNWQSSNGFGVDDLLLLAKVADLAHTEALKLKSADRQASAVNEPAAA